MPSPNTPQKTDSASSYRMNGKSPSRLTVVAGVRYDLDTFISATISPRVSSVLRSVQRSYFPTVLFSGLSATHHAGKPVECIREHQPCLYRRSQRLSAGRQNLSPEQIISYDLGYQGWYLASPAQGSRRPVLQSHLGSDQPSQPIRDTRSLSNDIGSADIYGGEVGFEVLATKWLTGFANYSYQEIHQTFTGRVQRAGPHNKFNVGCAASGTMASTPRPYSITMERPTIRQVSHLQRSLKPVSSPLPNPGRRCIQPAQSSRRVSLLAAEGRGGLYARRRSGRLRLQRAQRRTQRTSAGRPHRQTGDGMGNRKILMESSACSKQGFSA
jgi:hypothetical protein